MHPNERVGVILINTGTTAAPRPAETRTYLREFLSDPRVLDMSSLTRWLILNLFILPFRPKQSAHAYEKIWTDNGSPLLVISRELQAALEKRMPGVYFEIGMRYGEPSIPNALEKLLARHPDRLIVAPLFPQYASASNGSAIQRVFEVLAEKWNVQPVSVLPEFYNDEGFLDAWAESTRPQVDAFKPDHVLLSYHGLPERHVVKSDTSGNHCLQKPGCCDVIDGPNKHCYRAQCLYTSREIIRRLALPAEMCTTSFQSRLGSDPWLKPATDEVIPDLAKRGVKRLLVLCPAFSADCLETLEEIGIRGKEAFIESGGEDLLQAPCLNTHPRWVDALASLLERL
jgi:ferrochelatase